MQADLYKDRVFQRKGRRGAKFAEKTINSREYRSLNKFPLRSLRSLRLCGLCVKFSYLIVSFDDIVG